MYDNSNRRHSLDCIFKPKSIAVVGASARVKSVGHSILRNVLVVTTTSGAVGFTGRVYAVNPNHLQRVMKDKEDDDSAANGNNTDAAGGTNERSDHNTATTMILNVPVYATIGDVPEAAGVDLAVIAVRASIVPQIVEQCGQAGVRGLVIVSAGFEFLNDQRGMMTTMQQDEDSKSSSSSSSTLPVDTDGTAKNNTDTKNDNHTPVAAASSSSSLAIQEIARIARHYGMRIVGPNCLGVISPGSGLNASFASRMALKGNIAFISQSGALCSSILDWAAKQEVGFSHFISIGSMVDVSFPELIDYFGMDTHTTSILIYMESLPAACARQFMSATRAFARSKVRYYV
jgi:acetyltransferase